MINELNQTAGQKGLVRRSRRPISIDLVRHPRLPSYRRTHPGMEMHLQSLFLACRWISDIACVRSDILSPDENPHAYPYRRWRGAIREYNARTRQWHVFGPLWHTGQAVKALVMAYRVCGDRELLDAAIRSAEFILEAQISDLADPHFGLIYAFENADPAVSATSCMLEALDGLVELAEETGDERYRRAVLAALRWAHRETFLPDEGLFLDDFGIQTGKAASAPNTLKYGVPGRPLVDDAIFLRGYHLGGDADLRQVFFSTAERLLLGENPPGNWVNYPPCSPSLGTLHPRQAFWWGRPMVLAWRESGDERFLACAQRSADWYVQAQRSDGGMFRATQVDFRTPSFGQAASGILAAACLWRDLIAAGHGDQYREPLQRAIRYGRDMQFTQPSDPNLTGAILEICEPPDGTDRPPFTVRDLASIFYVQALAGAMMDDLLDH